MDFDPSSDATGIKRKVARIDCCKSFQTRIPLRLGGRDSQVSMRAVVITIKRQLVAKLKSLQPTTAHSITPSDIHELEVSIHELENLMNSVTIFHSSQIGYAETQIDAFRI
ncbi:hypothetical protein CPC08DRAFT_730285 [Agrocybe pediades]|nr:hypothetical protein CPC08DRAFT_730285 [Agrocybe pediades]